MKQVDLKFPVFSFGKDGDNMIYINFSEEDYHKTSLNTLKRNYFNNLEVVDSNGKVYRIEKANFVKYEGLWGFWSLLTTERRITVDFDYEDTVEEISLDNFKERITPLIDKEKEMWTDVFGNAEELKLLISACRSFEEIARLFL